MSEKSPWVKLVEQISSPWDWAAAAAGAAGGLGATILLHGTELGTSMAAGATGGVAARKAISASLQGWQVKRRAAGLLKQIEQSLEEYKALSSNPSIPLTPNDPAYRLLQLRIRLKQEVGLKNNRATPNEEFAKQIDKLTEEYRQIISGADHLGRLLGP